MNEVIGLDEKDIDKAMLDGNGMPVRAPRDIKAGEGFWVKMYSHIPDDQRSESGLRLTLDTENYDAALLEAKEKLRGMTE